ncbi:hypothetical protein [Parapedobacter indicus]|uniref:Uncharacterized protein n=1 Tax=Parapedobacter indicus TaxID=1477437 RepID=A0A1I3N7P5_9SPHI|nr:hypothetical protein [Parapedobacter indicus]PPL00904.1 hypothetical protein CLV26_107124 [Parapedobacter indicus]SFJ05267.1 hypothetical protein SAMN05444682_107124 [Parapedobacter indicus]
MKFKQKKLKAENFRYVIKRVIKNPMIYLNDFFGSQTRINYWLRDINLIVNHAVCSDMACPALSESGFHCRQLIEQVEVAYVIYKQCRLKKHVKPLEFFKTKKDYWAFVLDGDVTFDGKVNPADTLSKFFSYQSLLGWYETLDDMMMYLADQTGWGDERFGDRIVAIRELLLRLAQALYHIYDNGGLSVQMPSYLTAYSVDAKDGDADEEGADEPVALGNAPEATGELPSDERTEEQNQPTETQ